MGKLNVHQSISMNNERIREGNRNWWWKILNFDCSTFFPILWELHVLWLLHVVCQDWHAVVPSLQLLQWIICLSYRKAQRSIDSKLYTSNLCGRVSEKKVNRKKNLLCEMFCFPSQRWEKSSQNSRKSISSIIFEVNIVARISEVCEELEIRWIRLQSWGPLFMKFILYSHSRSGR